MNGCVIIQDLTFELSFLFPLTKPYHPPVAHVFHHFPTENKVPTPLKFVSSYIVVTHLNSILFFFIDLRRYIVCKKYLLFILIIIFFLLTHL